MPTPRPTRMSIWTTKDRNKESDQFLQCSAKQKNSKLSNHTEAVRLANWVDCRTGIINGKRTNMPICNSKHALCVLSEKAITYVSKTWWRNCLKVYLKMWKSIEKPLAKINADRWTNRSTSWLMFYRHKHQQAMWKLAWKSDSDDQVAKLRHTDKFKQTTEKKVVSSERLHEPGKRDIPWRCVQAALPTAAWLSNTNTRVYCLVKRQHLSHRLPSVPHC